MLYVALRGFAMGRLAARGGGVRVSGGCRKTDRCPDILIGSRLF